MAIALNPNTMSVNEIAAEATVAQIVAGITRVHESLLGAVMAGHDTAEWAKMHAKLVEALRLKTAPRRIQAPESTSRSVRFVGIGVDGLATYRGPHLGM
jgi:hypothetical protein